MNHDECSYQLSHAYDCFLGTSSTYSAKNWMKKRCFHSSAQAFRWKSKRQGMKNFWSYLMNLTVNVLPVQWYAQITGTISSASLTIPKYGPLCLASTLSESVNALESRNLSCGNLYRTYSLQQQYLTDATDITGLLHTNNNNNTDNF